MEIEKCRLCGEANTSLLSIPSKRLFRCKNCDFIFAAKSSLPRIDDEKSRYLKHNNTELEYEKYFENKLEALSSELDLDFKSSTTVLDYGSGPSNILEKVFRKNYSLQISSYDSIFSPIDLPVCEYDYIFCIETAEHFHNPSYEFEKLKRLLKNNRDSMIIIETGMTDSFFGEDKELDNMKLSTWWYLRDVTHVGFYCEKSVRVLAHSLGMKYQIMDNQRGFVLGF
ncbi:MAG: hypothetical protein Kapaf2KO_13690 [Candidatus Kapaibacteriales bacterium]